MAKEKFKSFFLFIAVYCLASGTSTLARGADSSNSKDGDNDDEANVCKCIKVMGLNTCCKGEKLDEQTGVSVGVTVGLLFLGIAVGTIVTALICVFVPSLHRKTDRVRRKVTRRFHKTLEEDRYQTPQELDHSVTDDRLNKSTAISNPKLPTAPVSFPGLDQDGYQDLDDINRARYSHAYTGLQSKQPGGDSGSQSPEKPPGKLPKAIISPVYREFTDNIVPSSKTKTKQNDYSENQNSKEENQAIRNVITRDSANHKYFVLEPQNESKDVISCDNERPVSDHPYFVLKEQNA